MYDRLALEISSSSRSWKCKIYMQKYKIDEGDKKLSSSPVVL